MMASDSSPVTGTEIAAGGSMTITGTGIAAGILTAIEIETTTVMTTIATETGIAVSGTTEADFNRQQDTSE